MAIGEIKEYSGTKYIVVGPKSGCSGCAFLTADNGCAAFNSEMDNNCYDDQSIWKETAIWEEKYTIEEVIDCLINALWITKSDREAAIKTVNQRIALMTDPDYKKFLELKEKFKDIT